MSAPSPLSPITAKGKLPPQLNPHCYIYTVRQTDKKSKDCTTATTNLVTLFQFRFQFQQFQQIISAAWWWALRSSSNGSSCKWVRAALSTCTNTHIAQMSRFLCLALKQSCTNGVVVVVVVVVYLCFVFAILNFIICHFTNGDDEGALVFDCLDAVLLLLLSAEVLKSKLIKRHFVKSVYCICIKYCCCCCCSWCTGAKV